MTWYRTIGKKERINLHDMLIGDLHLQMNINNLVKSKKVELK